MCVSASSSCTAAGPEQAIFSTGPTDIGPLSQLTSSAHVKCDDCMQGMPAEAAGVDVSEKQLHCCWAQAEQAMVHTGLTEV